MKLRKADKGHFEKFHCCRLGHAKTAQTAPQGTTTETVTQAKNSRNSTPVSHSYTTCIGSNTHTTSSHNRHLCRASYCNNTYPVSENHTKTAPKIPNHLSPVYTNRKTVPKQLLIIHATRMVRSR